MSHLGRWLSALVDGELDGMERDRVLNHVAGCDTCREEANAMRALKRRLTALGEACADTAITGRLIELARIDQDPSAGRRHEWARLAPAEEAGSFSRHRARVNRTGLKVSTGAAGSALIAIALAAFLLGSGSDGRPVPRITPSVDSYLLQHSRDAGEQPAVAGIGQQFPGRPGYERYKANPGGSAGQGQLGPPSGSGWISRPMAQTGTGGSPGPVVSVSASP